MMTRRLHRRALATLAATSAVLAMVETRAAHVGCTKDVECKGMRICENGRCVYPPPETEAQGPSAAASVGPATTPATPATGTPQSPVPPAGTEAAAPAVPPNRTNAAPSVSAVAEPAPPAAPPRNGEVGGPSRVAPRASWVRQPSRRFPVEVGGFGFGIDDWNAGAFGGGVEAGYRFSRWLAIGAWLEGSGKRQKRLPFSYAYRLYDLGLGLTVGETVGPLLADLSVLPELTWQTVEDRYLVPGTSVTLWGAAAGARLRMGPRLGQWCPFIFVAGSYAFWVQSHTVYHQHVYSGSVPLPRGNVSIGLGLAYLFGVASSDETVLRWPSPAFDD